MNVFLLSLIEKSMGRAMVKLSELPIQTTIVSPFYKQLLDGLSNKVFDTYLNFFKSVKLIPQRISFKKDKITKKFAIKDFSAKDHSLVDRKLIKLIRFPIHNTVIPVNLRVSQSEWLRWYSGVALLEDSNQAEFFLNELSMSTACIRYSSKNLHYLDRLFEGGQILEPVPPRKLASDFGKNYNQFQNDCKNHFGDTFHQFQNKIKMLQAVGDVLFTNYSLKEIAYKNNFFNYNSMYMLFCKKYEFPLHSIPRLLTEI